MHVSRRFAVLAALLLSAAAGTTSAFANTAPQLTLVYPLGTVAQGGALVTFKATATDAEQGNLSSSITWSSNKRGLITTGSEVRIYMNTTGYETFTAKIVDSGGLQDTEVRTFNVQTVVTTGAAVWHDPNLAGGFLSFNELVTGDWIATWMGFEFDFWALLNYYPVWFQSGVDGISAGFFASDLGRNTWNPSPSPGSATRTVIGDIAVQVETDKQVRLTVTNTTAQNIDAVFVPFTYANGPGAYLAESSPGVIDPGWVVFRGNTVFGAANQEARFVITFDGTEPRWVMGWGQPTTTATAYFPVDLHAWWPHFSHSTLPSSTYMGDQAFWDAMAQGDVSISGFGTPWTRSLQTMSGATVR